MVDALDRPLDKATHANEPVPLDGSAKSNTTPEEYRAMVLRAKEYILAGDIFQVVLSQRFEAPFALPPFALYRALRRVNPAPFLYFLRVRRLCDCRIEPGNPGAGAKRNRNDPADRGNTTARRNPAR